jgi:hypothetical protein
MLLAITSHVMCELPYEGIECNIFSLLLNKKCIYSTMIIIKALWMYTNPKLL